MLELSPKTFDDFRAARRGGNVVPVVRSVLADLHTPVSAFLRIAGDERKAFLFESIEGGERLARYSFLAADPLMTVRARGSQTIIEKDAAENETIQKPIFDFLREYFAKNKLAARDNLPPLCGGAVGYLAYDAVRFFEPSLDDGARRDANDAVWMFFKNVLAFDRLKQRIEIISVVFTDEAENDDDKLKNLYDSAVRETELIEQRLNESFALPDIAKFAPDAAKNEFVSNWTKPDFLRAVEKIQESILAGDAYQVVLSQNFRREYRAAPIDIYRALRTTNPSPYMFFMRLGAETLVGASPEMLVRARGEKLEYCPIAGTRRRGANDAEDARLGEDLRRDKKEVSEHIMLVDLGRNDLGRVAEFGSVEVAELMKIERYSHVQHLVTNLRGKLRGDCDRFDALAACFPAGTVSGAPKVSAMRIISELEPTRRGVYAGAVGYIDYAENLDTCIAIRTIQLRENFAAIQAGAGIVADSIPEAEYEETISKARALVRAIEIAENGI